MGILSFDQVSKIYRMGEVTIKAADKIFLCRVKGEFCVIVGRRWKNYRAEHARRRQIPATKALFCWIEPDQRL